MNNYKEIKNLIHNEFNITKEEIRETISKAIEKEIQKMMKDEQFLSSLIQNELKSILNREYRNPKYKKIFNLNELIYDNVCSEISKVVHDNIKIKVGLNSKNLETYEIDNDKLF